MNMFVGAAATIVSTAHAAPALASALTDPVPPTPDVSDAGLFSLYEEFLAAHAVMEVLGCQGGGAVCSGASATRKQRAIQRKWERSIETATKKARLVVQAPAATLDGMLLKIHLVGFLSTDIKKGTFDPIYHPGVKNWKSRRAESDELDVILALRSDLERFAAATT